MKCFTNGRLDFGFTELCKDEKTDHFMLTLSIGNVRLIVVNVTKSYQARCLHVIGVVFVAKQALTLFIENVVENVCLIIVNVKKKFSNENVYMWMLCLSLNRLVL